jgi:hypothetical protein
MMSSESLAKLARLKSVGNEVSRIDAMESQHQAAKEEIEITNAKRMVEWDQRALKRRNAELEKGNVALWEFEARNAAVFERAIEESTVRCMMQLSGGVKRRYEEEVYPSGGRISNLSSAIAKRAKTSEGINAMNHPVQKGQEFVSAKPPSAAAPHA